jgi:hypothetical protein
MPAVAIVLDDGPCTHYVLVVHLLHLLRPERRLSWGLARGEELLDIEDDGA